MHDSILRGKTGFRWAVLLVFGAVLVGICSALAAASEMLETDDFKAVQARANELGKVYGPKNVLLVFDIDETLLTANQPLGSDRWYDWQADLLEKCPASPLLAAKDLDGLARVQSLLYALGHMRPTRKDQPGIVKEIQSKGFRTLVLTARWPDTRDATMRHLEEGGYSFADSAPEVSDAFRGVRLPFHPEDVGASGLSAAEAKRLKPGMPKEVSYDRGVFMVSEQDKGVMLLVLLAHCPRRFSAVIFVDDKEKNARDVFSALAGRGIEVVAFRYSGEDEAVKAFSDQQKQETDRDWRELDRTINRLLKREPAR